MYYLMPSSKRKTWSPYFIFREIIDYFGRCCFHGLGEFHSLRKVLSEKQSPVDFVLIYITMEPRKQVQNKIMPLFDIFIN